MLIDLKPTFLIEEEPHLEQTIFPPKDRSETNEEKPQLTQTLSLIIFKIDTNYLIKLYA